MNKWLWIVDDHCCLRVDHMNSVAGEGVIRAACPFCDVLQQRLPFPSPCGGEWQGRDCSKFLEIDTLNGGSFVAQSYPPHRKRHHVRMRIVSQMRLDFAQTKVQRLEKGLVERLLGSTVAKPAVWPVARGMGNRNSRSSEKDSNPSQGN